MTNRTEVFCSTFCVGSDNVWCVVRDSRMAMFMRDGATIRAMCGVWCVAMTNRTEVFCSTLCVVSDDVWCVERDSRMAMFRPDGAMIRAMCAVW